MTNFQKAIGQTIRYLRKQRGLTQKELSERSSFERSYISEVEAGSRNIALNNLKRLAQAFDLATWELLKIAESLPEYEDSDKPV
jgi:transcriptional regulator with XRE-family HTH domain